VKTLITLLEARSGPPSPGELWFRAGGDGARYRQLLREYGYLVPGTPQPLPCGYPAGRRVSLDYGAVIWRIASQSGNGVYDVRQLPDGRWYCPCLDFEYRGHERVCKHIVTAKQRAAAATQSQDGRGKVTE
jgi:hypothetical protein